MRGGFQFVVGVRYEEPDGFAEIAPDSACVVDRAVPLNRGEMEFISTPWKSP